MRPTVIGRVSAVLVVCLLVSSLFSIFAPRATASALTPHSAISINGNAGFTASNGVRSGSGTPSDPYIISGWDICPCGASAGVQVSNTNANFAIQSVYVHDGGAIQYGIIFTNVTNGRAENSTLAYNSGGIVIDRSNSIAFSGNNVSVFDDPGYNDVCITVSSSANIVVSGNVLSPCPAGGMDAEGNNNIVISDNKFIQDSGGLFLGSETTATIKNNQFGPGTDLGFYVFSGASVTQTTVSGNTFSGEGIYIQGQNIQLSSNTITPDNLVNGKPIYYFEDCLGTSIDGVPVGQLIVSNCTNFQATNLRIDNVVEGIVMISVHGASITNVSLNAAWYGVLASNSDHVTISHSNVTADYGIQFYNTNNMLVYYNNLLCPGSWCDFGFTTGQEGAAMDYQGSNNLWDNGYPSGGNFWYNYPGVDNCSGPQQNVCPNPDGIGDTAYGPDRYPLMKPFTAQASDPQFQQTFTFDGVVVSVFGSFIPDTTSRTVTGKVSVNVTSSATGQTVFSKTYSITVGYGSDSTARFVLAIPASSSWLGAACTVNISSNRAGCSLSRDPDLNHDGAINILDLAQIAFAYGSANGDSRYNASGDLNADGLINIFDLAMAAFDYQQPVFS